MACILAAMRRGFTSTPAIWPMEAASFTLEAISAERLVLVKDNKRIVYPLKLKEKH